MLRSAARTLSNALTHAVFASLIVVTILESRAARRSDEAAPPSVAAPEDAKTPTGTGMATRPPAAALAAKRRGEARRAANEPLVPSVPETPPSDAPAPSATPGLAPDDAPLPVKQPRILPR